MIIAMIQGKVPIQIFSIIYFMRFGIKILKFLIVISSYTELGIEATCDQSEENNESTLLSLFDGNDSFGNFLSNPYENNQEEKVSEIKQYGTTGDEFLPSQLLSDLLFGSSEPITKVN